MTERGFTVVDKRHARTPEHAARIEAAQIRDADAAADELLAQFMRAGQAHFAQQAAGTLFWEAQHAAHNGNPALAESILTEHDAFVLGAREKGIFQDGERERTYTLRSNGCT